MQEKDIIQKVIKDDKEAFAHLFFKYEKFIFNVVKKFIKHEQDAEDIVQEVLLKDL